MKILTYLLIFNFLLFNTFLCTSQCADSLNVYSFNYDGKTYEIIKENKSWVDAAACAVERGGILTEINDINEQNAVFNELSANAGVNPNNTIAPDGGNSSYLWLGGNDLATEGNWVWNGNNDNNSTQFWTGTFSSGSPVGGLYNNWGNEPDNWGTGGQDALGMSVNGWPLGSAGQWNDVNHNNTLYFIVEIGSNTGEIDREINITIYPNPSSNVFTINTTGYTGSIGWEVYNLQGKLLESNSSTAISLDKYAKGIYLCNITYGNTTKEFKLIKK